MSVKVEFWEWVEMIRRKKLKAPFDELDYSTFSPFVHFRALAMDPNAVVVVNELNKYIYTLPKELLFKLAFLLIPPTRQFVPYVKKQKLEDETINVIARQFKISKREARIYMQFISKKELRQIKAIYKGGVK